MDYVNLYLVHWPVKETYVSVWKKMEAVYKSGKAKAIGVSNYQTHHLADLLEEAEIIPAVNQIECYPLPFPGGNYPILPGKEYPSGSMGTIGSRQIRHSDKPCHYRDC